MPTVSELIETINAIGAAIEDMNELDTELRTSTNSSLKSLAWSIFTGIYHGTRKCAAFRWRTTDVASIQEATAREARAIDFRMVDVYVGVEAVRNDLVAIVEAVSSADGRVARDELELLLRRLEVARTSLNDEFAIFLISLRQRAETVTESDAPDFEQMINAYADEFFHLKQMISVWVQN